jgi:hypothetical protein
MFFKKRAEPNGIKKGQIVKLKNTAATQSQAIKDASRHTVSYSYGSKAIIKQK